RSARRRRARASRVRAALVRRRPRSAARRQSRNRPAPRAGAGAVARATSGLPLDAPLQQRRSTVWWSGDARSRRRRHLAAAGRQRRFSGGRMTTPTLVVPWKRGDDPGELLTREWLVTNGLGGYASGTVESVATRRYHGLFVPNLPSPYGRTMIVPRLDEE